MKRVRATCLRNGHKVRGVMVSLPFEFCARWFCDWSEVSTTHPSISDPLRREFQKTATEQNIEAMENIVNMFGMRVRNG